MATEKCLHCHLIDAANEWGREHGEADRVALVHNASRFLCDMMVSVTSPGKDRTACVNSATIGIVTMMAARMDEVYRHEEDGAPAGASKH